MNPPSGETLPTKGFDAGVDFYQPPGNDDNIEVKIDPKSNRLKLLEPFSKWNGEDLIDSRILIKVNIDLTKFINIEFQTFIHNILRFLS